ncbi:MAG: efflux RND transporter periplasmic adaptor subunit [Bacillota bacterium]|jgi:RND family efflux transporter MFP subunit
MGCKLVKKRGLVQNRWWCFFLVLTLLVLPLSGWGCRNEVATGEQEIRPVPVQVATVTRGSITRNITLAGKITPYLEVGITPKVSGKVVSVSVDVGDTVQKGQVLAQLDTTDIEAQLRQAEAGLTVAQVNQQLAAITLENARVNLERVKELHNQGVVSDKDLEMAQMAFDQANSGLADAQVKQAEAGLDLIKNQLQNFTLTAPISGMVASRTIDPGEMVMPGGPVITLVDISRVVVECSVPEGEVNRIKTGEKIKIRVPAAAAEPFEGEITSIAPAADPVSKSFPVKIQIANSEQLLKPGMFAEVELATEAFNDVLILPKEAVVDKGDMQIVYVVRDGRAYEAKVRTGASDLNSVVIVEGVQAGDQVVAVGQNTVKDQTAVEIVPGAATAVSEGAKS